MPFVVDLNSSFFVSFVVLSSLKVEQRLFNHEEHGVHEAYKEHETINKQKRHKIFFYFVSFVVLSFLKIEQKLFNHEGYEESQRTKRFIPSLNTSTLKFMRSPTLISANLMQVSSCASWIPITFSTHFSSTINFLSTKMSIRYPQFSLISLYSTGNGHCSVNGTPDRASSWARHCSYVDSNRPGPSVLWTSRAQPMTLFDSLSNFTSCPSVPGDLSHLF